MTNLFAAVPADCKSTAAVNCVTPTPTPPNDTFDVIAFITTPGNISEVLIPIEPVEVTKILSSTASLILSGLFTSGFVPIPIEVIDACAAVTIPAMVKLFNVDIPTVVLELP